MSDELNPVAGHLSAEFSNLKTRMTRISEKLTGRGEESQVIIILENGEYLAMASGRNSAVHIAETGGRYEGQGQTAEHALAIVEQKLDPADRAGE